MSAIANANCVWRAPRKARKSPCRSTRISNAICSSTCVRPLCRRCEAKAVLEVAKERPGILRPYHPDQPRPLQRWRHCPDRSGPHRIASRAVRGGDSDGHRQPAHRQDPAAAIARRPHARRTVRCDRAFDFSDDLKPLEDFRQIALDARPDLRAALERSSRPDTITSWPIANGSTDPTFSAWYT